MSRRGLETFLGGMETVIFKLSIRKNTYLETFLGGMETQINDEIYKATLNP